MVVASIVALLAWAAAAASECEFPATGQTTCWSSSGAVIACPGTGQDGDVRAGRRLRYQDNGNGTITDRVTGLIWEKLSMDGSVHDVKNTYQWHTAFSTHIDGLNAAHFAGHHDWRLPNVKELESLIDYETFNPAVASAFNTNCTSSCTVLTCSCTGRYGYWSSSSFANGPSIAWSVSFGFGNVAPGAKSPALFVRAVRGGCE
jgi:hypothetical protein